MESNKDEALRCIGIAKQAIASRDKQRALKFIRIARRLNHNLCVDDLLAACEELDASSSADMNPENDISGPNNKARHVKVNEFSNGERNYSEEHVQLIRQIKSKSDYYAILGVDKSCSVEEIRKAYRKLSLKVHPDKNKAPGSEEAFKKVSRAFKCLSDDVTRRQYDQTGLVEEFEQTQQHNVRRRRRRTGNDFLDDDFDPDEIFRAFFGHDMYRAPHVYRTRATADHPREDLARNGPNLMILLQILPWLIIILLASFPFSEPEYSLQRNYTYQFGKTMEKYGVEYFVRSREFDEKYPLGSPARENIEFNVIRDYKNMLHRYCHIERQRHQFNRKYPTPHCDKLDKFEVA